MLLSLGVSGDGGVPLRLGVRDGNCSESVETPVAIEECLALSLEGVRSMVAQPRTPPLRYVRGASGMVKINRSPTFRPAREPGVIAKTTVWPSDVRTFT